MLLTRLDNAVTNTQCEHPHSIIKNTSVNGVTQQIVKQQNGNYMNMDYELLHQIDL